MKMNRRSFLQLAGVGAAVVALPLPMAALSADDYSKWMVKRIQRVVDSVLPTQVKVLSLKPSEDAKNDPHFDQWVVEYCTEKNGFMEVLEDLHTVTTGLFTGNDYLLAKDIGYGVIASVLFFSADPQSGHYRRENENLIDTVLGKHWVTLSATT